MTEILFGVLFLSTILNGYLFWKWKTKKVELNDHHSALLEAIVEFETKRHALIDVQLINPDNVYLRNPSAGR